MQRGTSSHDLTVGELRGRELKVIALRIAAASLLLASSSAIAAHAAKPADVTDTAVKAAPTQPKASSNAVTEPLSDKDKTARPETSNSARSALLPVAWSVNLTASSTSLWPAQYTTLTATANADVTYTPYYIAIYDTTSNTSVAICGTGTSCSGSVTQNTATTHSFRAFISYYSTTVPTSGIQASSSYVTVTWRGVSISLAASPTTTYIGGTSTLTSTASTDLGPTPFYAVIFDTTTNTFLKICGFGTTCSVNVSQSVATTHTFLAYVSSYGTSLPLPHVQATSDKSFVTWANTGYRVSLTTSRTSYGHDTLTAISNVNVAPTPYWIEIFNLNTGARVALCGGGTVCSTNVALSFGKNTFVAFTSANSTTIPPFNTQASSSVVSSFFFPIFTPL